MKKSKYRDLKFKSEEDLGKWLSEKTKVIVYFSDNDFDPTRWWIDRNGEILHSDLQASVWNGQFVDMKYLRTTYRIKFQDGRLLKHIPRKLTII